MQQERSNAKSLSPEELSHLEHLRTVVERALGDGQLSLVEQEQIKSLLWTNGKITYEELRVVHETVEWMTGDSTPELEWRPYKR